MTVREERIREILEEADRRVSEFFRDYYRPLPPPKQPKRTP